MDRVTTQRGVLVLAGPRSREVLAKVADIDVSNEAFPWLTARRLSIRSAGLIAMRVNFVGELGYELHHPIEMQNAIFDALMSAGAPFGIKPFGIRAMDSLRLEKSYKLVGRELSIEYAALESGLDRFVDFKKGPFLGRDALIAWVGKGVENRLVTLEVQGVSDADARGSEPVMKDGAMVGRTTSGGYGWRTGKSLALAMVKPEFSNTGGEVEIRILGETRRAVVDRREPVRSGEHVAARLKRLGEAGCHWPDCRTGGRARDLKHLTPFSATCAGAGAMSAGETTWAERDGIVAGNRGARRCGGRRAARGHDSGRTRRRREETGRSR